MDDSVSVTTTPDSWSEEFSQTLAQHRSRVQQFLAEQRARWEQAHAALTGQVGQLCGELDAERSQRAEARQQLERRAEELARLEQELRTRQAEWESAQSQASAYLNHLAEHVRRQEDELERREAELHERHEALGAAEARLGAERQSLALAREEHRAAAEHVAQLRQRLEAALAETSEAREQLAAQNARLQAQRRRIAREFKDQRAGHLRELERRRAELRQLGANQASDLQQQIERQQSELDRREIALATARQRQASLEGELSATKARLAQVEAQLGQAASAPRDDALQEDFRRRYEMALEDLRELKASNEELKKQLAAARVDLGKSGRASGEVLHWETEKRRILAALESDSDPSGQPDEAQRLRVEEVIRTTEEALAEKDREIHELRQLLENQSKSLGAVAVGAAALGAAVDSDAIVQEERANLRRLQQQWEEKLRQAEVEISLERAKIARERAELEGKRAAAAGPASPATHDANQPAAAEKPPRGRWLAKLGLKDPHKS